MFAITTSNDRATDHNMKHVGERFKANKKRWFCEQQRVHAE